jgi:hypothetical protein
MTVALTAYSRESGKRVLTPSLDLYSQCFRRHRIATNCSHSGLVRINHPWIDGKEALLWNKLRRFWHSSWDWCW